MTRVWFSIFEVYEFFQSFNNDALGFFRGSACFANSINYKRKGKHNLSSAAI